MLFPAAAGLIVERGSLLSHSAIVSRELGLPAVVGLADATTWICDDDLIELDGATGMVRKVKTATPPQLTSASPVSPSGMESDNAGAVIP
jgi:pyruvate,water dikinase